MAPTTNQVAPTSQVAPAGLGGEELTQEEVLEELERLRQRVAAYRAIVNRLLMERGEETIQ